MGEMLTAKELRRARALYIGHLLTRATCTAVVIAIGFDHLFKGRMQFGDWLMYAGYLAVAAFIIELLLAPLFKRKARPWHLSFSVPPEDRWPRG